jgi:hypothetical protein
MIKIPDDYKNSPFTDTKFKQLVEFFNDLEKQLEYPNCEGNEDATRILNKAQTDLTKWSVL